ncbi:FabD/lysophospholipase-like protein, partial [Plenodomus tracheiphilus IPT5]
ISADGGGIRGYWTLLVLERLVEYIAVEEESYIGVGTSEANGGSTSAQTPHPHSFYPMPFPENVVHHEGVVKPYEELSPAERFLPCHYFDYICGSSTGGYYETLSHSVFGKPRLISQRSIGVVQRSKYSAQSMEDVFKDVTRRRCEGSARTMHNFTPPSFGPSIEGTCATLVIFHHFSHMVTTLRKTKTEKGINPETLYLIRSYDNDPDPRPVHHMNKNYGQAEKMKIWQVARAATAAPMYFSELKVTLQEGDGRHEAYFTDGGFGAANNPTQAAYEDLEAKFKSKAFIGAVVSLGTARARDHSTSHGIIRRVKKFANVATDPRPVAEFMLSRGLRHYWRFNDEDGIQVDLDEWKPNGWLTKQEMRGSKTLKKIQDAFHRWTGQMDTQNRLKACAKLLVDRRRERTVDLSRWQRLAVRAEEYKCRHRLCTEDKFDTLYRFEVHWHQEHMNQEDASECERPSFKEWQYQKPNGQHPPRR